MRYTVVPVEENDVQVTPSGEEMSIVPINAIMKQYELMAIRVSKLNK